DAQVAGLNAALEQAGRRNDELLLMAEMLRAIDGLGSSRDAGPAIARCFSGLLPGRAGTVYLRREPDDMLERLVQWGAATDHPAELPPEACGALCSGRSCATAGAAHLRCA